MEPRAFAPARLTVGLRRTRWGCDAGEPSITRLVEDFGLPDPGPIAMTFGIAGDPVAHSLSPRLHNACYPAMGIPAVFLPFEVDSFDEFWGELAAAGPWSGWVSRCGDDRVLAQ